MGEESESKKLRGCVLFGTVIVVGCVVALFVAPRHVLWKLGIGHGHRGTPGLVMATSLASAVENFYGEYNELPDVGASEFDTASPEGVRLLEMLLGLEGTGPDAQNIRSVIFLQGKEAKGKKGGIDYGDGGSVLGIYDPFGNSYTVVLNSKYEDKLVFNFGDKTVKLRGKQVAVYSFGPDGEPNTADDIKSWN